jgi:pyruvate/2-oxoglutarate dehydrogenase complex dihydrolipoamide acyltransferase (E2) component
VSERDSKARVEEARIRAAREASEDTDVVLDVPLLNVEELDLEVDELQAHISARAELAGFLNINVGVDAYVNGVKLNIKGVEAQVQLKVRLERILGSIDRALQAIEDNPDLLNRDSRRSERPQRPEESRELPAGPGEEEGDGAADVEVGATPAARKRAEDLGVDLSSVTGTGAEGRVLVKDVMEAASG